jgi:hypothetical protein
MKQLELGMCSVNEIHENSTTHLIGLQRNGNILK